MKTALFTLMFTMLFSHFAFATVKLESNVKASAKVSQLVYSIKSTYKLSKTEKLHLSIVDVYAKSGHVVSYKIDGDLSEIVVAVVNPKHLKSNSKRELGHDAILTILNDFSDFKYTSIGVITIQFGKFKDGLFGVKIKSWNPTYPNEFEMSEFELDENKL